MRSPKNVVDEMQLVHDKYGVEQVTFYDDAFTVDRNSSDENLRRAAILENCI